MNAWSIVQDFECKWSLLVKLADECLKVCDMFGMLVIVAGKK